MAIPRITVLISGRGSNLEALLGAEHAGQLSGTIASVISNRPNAAGLHKASTRGIPTAVVDHERFADRDAFDTALAQVIDAGAPDLIVLAGFMRIFGRAFVLKYAGRMLNIHPSLLPAYPGLRTHRRALADGVRIHGCTVHFVTPDLDHGPIVAQGAVPVLQDDDEATLAARVLAAEHRILPASVRAFCERRIVIADGRVRIDGFSSPSAALLVPLANWDP